MSLRDLLRCYPEGVSLHLLKQVWISLSSVMYGVQRLFSFPLRNRGV